ncbi:MAG: pilus assembly protein N-terminal domain-containing protein [Neomegalonema sp.]|nr:pilus assembly protein N-terminal domain-containing protein [Neomegalonema sp.]
MPSAVATTERASRSISMSRILRLASSAVVAFAAAYRNVAFAGPAASPAKTPADPSTYTAPYDEGCAGAAYRADVKCIVVRMDHLRRLPFARPIGTLMVGNPAIADVTLIRANEAVITAKSVGATNMILLDDKGEVIADLEIVVHEPARRRVIMRRGPTEVASYQCAPRCERSLSLNDSPTAYSALAGKISSEAAMSTDAAGARKKAAPHRIAPSPSKLSTSRISNR